MNNKILITVVSAIAIVGFLFVAYQLTNNGQSSSVVNPNVSVINATDHVEWSPDKKNILVEYADFQCPSCAEFHAFLKQMEASGSADSKIIKNITFVERDFPLYQIHDKAYDSAYAAEAAGLQGKYFEMADLLFTNQQRWENDPNYKNTFVSFAKQLGLNVDQFQKDWNSKEVKDKVNNDLLSGQQAGVDATPTFYLNGKKLSITSFDQFKTLLLSP